MNSEIQNKQKTKEVIQEKNEVLAWIRAHKKQLIRIGSLLK